MALFLIEGRRKARFAEVLLLTAAQRRDQAVKPQDAMPAVHKVEPDAHFRRRCATSVEAQLGFDLRSLRREQFVRDAPGDREVRAIELVAAPILDERESAEERSIGAQGCSPEGNEKGRRHGGCALYSALSQTSAISSVAVPTWRPTVSRATS